MLAAHGWKLEKLQPDDDTDPEYPDAYLRKLGGDSYRFLVGDDGVELERA